MDNDKELNRANPGSTIQSTTEKTGTGLNTEAGALERNIEAIMTLEKESMKSHSRVEHIADKVTAIAGSTPFIIFHLVWFTVWIILNEHVFKGLSPFDPYPFSFLTLVVSLEAIFLTLLVLMSQNTMTKVADKRAHLDLQINMLDEQETTRILRMVQRIAEHLGIDDLQDDQLQELTKETDIGQVARSLDEQAGGK